MEQHSTECDDARSPMDLSDAAMHLTEHREKRKKKNKSVSHVRDSVAIAQPILSGEACESRSPPALRHYSRHGSTLGHTLITNLSTHCIHVHTYSRPRQTGSS